MEKSLLWKMERPIFIIALRSLTLPTRIRILEQAGVFLTPGSFKWDNCVFLSPWHVISFSFKKN